MRAPERQQDSTPPDPDPKTVGDMELCQACRSPIGITSTLISPRGAQSQDLASAGSPASLQHRHPSPSCAGVNGNMQRTYRNADDKKSPTCVALKIDHWIPEDMKIPVGLPALSTADRLDVRPYATDSSQIMAGDYPPQAPQKMGLLLNSPSVPHMQTGPLLKQRRVANSSALQDTNTLNVKPEVGWTWSQLKTKAIVPAVLSLLVVQNACQMLSMRYSKVVAAQRGAVEYLSSTAVVVSEALKVVACLVILAVEHKGNLAAVLYRDVIYNWKDTLLVSVPAFVYMIQNNLLYLAASNLDAATCQITYQLKILTTALFAVGMLGKQISRLKWLSLGFLMAGIALVQLPSSSATISTVGNPVVGFSAVISACFMSGFAGVYFEKMGSIGCCLAVIASLVKDGDAIAASGFFQGWNVLVAGVAAQVGLGGLVTALVVRHADNILKGFATSLSIILSGVVSLQVSELRFSPSPWWLVGSALVTLATCLYALPDQYTLVYVSK